MERSFFSLREAESLVAGPLAALRRELHEHPELSGQEFETVGWLRAFFDRAPFEVLPLPVDNALAVRIRGNGPGKRVAIRADMDALPVSEWAGNPIRSKNAGVMHACGHDVHMAFVCGAGLLLNEARARFAGEVLLLFQPAEETGEGAQKLLDARIDILGKGGHGACPHLCRDPIVAAAAVVMALQTVVSRASDPAKACVLSVCRVRGGEADNVIPDAATLEGTIRTTDPDQRSACLERLRALAEGAAAAMGCEAKVLIHRGMPLVVNDDGTARICRARAEALLGAENVTELPVDTISEDFALYAQRAPGCYIGVGVGEPGAALHSLHSDRFCPSDRLLPLGAAVFAEMALGLLNGEERL